MEVILPPTSSIIEERGRQFLRYVFKYNFDYSDLDVNTSNQMVLVTTKVLGTKLYTVKFWAKFSGYGDEVEFEPFNCNCPHDARVCKHMYGAMLSLSQDQKQLEGVFKEIDKLLDIRTEVTFDDELVLEDDIFAGFEDDIFDNSEEELIFGSYDPEEVQAEKEAYKQSLRDERERVKNANKVMSSPDTDRLLSMVMGEAKASLDNVEYELIPELHIDRDEYSLKFKIGIIGGKSFVIKDVYELPNLFDIKLTKRFGTSTDIDFVLNKFKDQAMVKFIINEIANGSSLLNTVSAKGKTDWYGYYTPGKVKYDKKSLILTERSLYTYLNMALNSQIKFKFEEERMTKFDIEKASEKINLEYEAYNNYVIITNDTYDQAISFDNHLIVISCDDKVIKLIDIDNKDSAAILVHMINNEQIVNRENSNLFNNAVMSRIKDYINFDYDLTEMYLDAHYVGFKTHIELHNDLLAIRVETNLPEFDDELDIAFDVEKFHLMQHLCALYNNEEITEFNNGEIAHISINSIKNIIEFVNDSLFKFEQLSEVMTSNEEFKNFKLVKHIPISVTTTRTKGKTILKFESSQFKESELLEVLKSFENDTKYLQLDSGVIVDLTSEEVAKVVQSANELELDLKKADSTEFEVDLASVFYYNKIFESMNMALEQDEVISSLIDDYNKLSSKGYRKPKELDAKLRDYQKLGVNWIDFLNKYNFGGILADDMGLGKTLQVITYLTRHKSDLPTLIITPASLVYNWKYEFEKFTTNSDVLVIDGQASKRQELWDSIDKQVCLISYDSFKRDVELALEHNYEYVILDEAQHIKNNNTKISKAVKVVDSNYRLALTGTPIENNLNDLWSLFEFIMPGYLGNNKQFKQRYITPIENGRDEVRDRLRRKVSPFIMRRLKEDVLTELPDKNEKVIHVQMEEEQHKLYDAQAALIKNFLEENSESEISQSQIEILAMITKLRQIACNPKLVNPKYKGGIAKQEYLVDHLQTLIENKHKTVVFSQFVSNFEHIEKELEASGIKYYKITGQTDKQKRYELVNKFNNNDVPVFLISLKAGGTGLNIVGADTVIHYDPWWNTAVESQATDRVHRMGQTKNVFVYKLICENTIEEQIVKLQEQKRELAENLLEAEGAKPSKLSKEELYNLFDN